MNEETARNVLMDELYGEITAADKKRLQAWLRDHPELQQEFDELRKTQSLLQKMPDVEPAKKLVIMEPRERSFSDWWGRAKDILPRSGWGKSALAAAACIILLLVAGSVANLNISTSQGGFSIHLGYAHQPKTAGLSQAQAKAIMQQIQQQNTAMLTEYADMLNKHNQQQLQQVVKYFEQQRLNDLQLVDKALDQYQQKNDYQLQQTNQVLGKVLQTVASNDQP